MDPKQLVKPLLIAAGLIIGLLALGVPGVYVALPLLIVICPLMMFFMMRGMDHGGSTEGARLDAQVPPTHEGH